MAVILLAPTARLVVQVAWYFAAVRVSFCAAQL
jgi:hypothetical protein